MPSDSHMHDMYIVLCDIKLEVVSVRWNTNQSREVVITGGTAYPGFRSFRICTIRSCDQSSTLASGEPH